MTRRRRARRRGCHVETVPGGRLALRFVLDVPGLGRKRVKETTALDAANPEHTDRVNRLADVIGAEIRNGTFDYVRHFPNGKWVPYFRPGQIPDRDPELVAGATTPTVGDWYVIWMARLNVPGVRVSRLRDYGSHWPNYLRDEIGHLPLTKAGTFAVLADLQATLRRRPSRRNNTLTEHTVKNVIGGTLRAMLRDAQKAHPVLNIAFEFDQLDWQRTEFRGGTPFSEEERDRLLRYYAAKRWKLPGGGTRLHYPYYAFLHALFHCWMRPSEAAALRVRDFDAGNRTLTIARSRHLGHEMATKNPTSQRTVRLSNTDVRVLEPLVALHAKPDDYLFRGVAGAPIDPAQFYEPFCAAQRVLKMTLRDLYSTKDTCISIALTKGVNLTWISRQTGVSEFTIRRNYAGRLDEPEWDEREFAKLEEPARPTTEIGPIALESGRITPSYPPGDTDDDEALVIPEAYERPRRDLNPEGNGENASLCVGRCGWICLDRAPVCHRWPKRPGVSGTSRDSRDLAN